jgi:hypothetical protein
MIRLGPTPTIVDACGTPIVWQRPEPMKSPDAGIDNRVQRFVPKIAPKCAIIRLVVIRSVPCSPQLATR